MSGKYYLQNRDRFQLHGSTQWRTPQIGALASLVSYWTLNTTEAALVSIPTGSGKTAIALAAPYLTPTPPKKVLVVVPSSDLRKQFLEKLESEGDLHIAGALKKKSKKALKVKLLDHMVKDWRTLDDFDVIVALPNVISPRHYEDKPQKSLFDLIIVDEAHHAPAETWLEILEYFDSSYKLLLTATPMRRDRKKLPGELIYYYPMKLALANNIYKPIFPILLEPNDTKDRKISDRQIAETCAEVLKRKEHQTSKIIVRASTIERAKELEILYDELGVKVRALYSGMKPPTERDDIIAQLREGKIQGACIVGMLTEGFDLPSIRILAYHDKHKSLPATVQMLGRLARFHQAHPQSSILVTLKDGEVYPQLQGVIKELYQEDSDWSKVLPGIVDGEITEKKDDLDFAKRFADEGLNLELSPQNINPLLRSIVYQAKEPDYRPFFAKEEQLIPEELQAGKKFNSGKIVLSSCDFESKMFILGVKESQYPRWSNDSLIKDVKYRVHVLTFHESPEIDKNNLIFFNVDGLSALTALQEILNINDVATLALPEEIGAYADCLNRHSISAVGVRNTNPAGRGTVGYRNFMGKGVHLGIRESDTNRSALGHGNFQIEYAGTTANGGFAIEKAKIWVTRYLPLRQYYDWVTDLASKIWNPSIGPSGPMLPGVDRGKQLNMWPNSRPLAAEMNPRLLGRSFAISFEGEDFYFEELELIVEQNDQPLKSNEQLIIDFRVCSKGVYKSAFICKMDLNGVWITDKKIPVSQGYGGHREFTELINDSPPTVFFLNGTTIIGRILYERTEPTVKIPEVVVGTADWTGVDIKVETKETAKKRTPPVLSIHEYLEEWILKQRKQGKHRWLFFNDGAGEIADYVQIETLDTGEIYMNLWHAKFADARSTSVRVNEFEKVVSQAIKSRRWYKQKDLWQTIARRLKKEDTPHAVLVSGSDSEDLLKEYLGINPSTIAVNWATTLPIVRGRICIVQPGFSKDKFFNTSLRDDISVENVNQLLTVFKDTAHADALDIFVLASA